MIIPMMTTPRVRVEPRKEAESGAKRAKAVTLHGMGMQGPMQIGL